MTEKQACQSCTMPIESGDYCQHCAPGGKLVGFDECLERMIQWTLRQKPGQDRAQAEADTRRFMSTMPAWKDAPQLSDRGGR